MNLRQPYLLFVGDAEDDLAAKTAYGIVYWRPDLCVGKLSLKGCRALIDLPEMSVDEAIEAGAKTMVIGVRSETGKLSETWFGPVKEALEAGLDVASGLLQRLNGIPSIREAAASGGREVINLRHSTQIFNPGTGKRRTGKRLLAVGTDASCGKMFTAFAIVHEMKNRGIPVDFRATGQTGIYLTGEGVILDAVTADCLTGAVEWLSPDNSADHWDIIEGQGALSHPALGPVAEGLLLGSQPDALIICHDPAREHMRGYPHMTVPTLEGCFGANQAIARRTNPDAKVVGISVNTKNLEGDKKGYLQELEETLGLPCIDPLITGVGPIVDQLV